MNTQYELYNQMGELVTNDANLYRLMRYALNYSMSVGDILTIYGHDSLPVAMYQDDNRIWFTDDFESARIAADSSPEFIMRESVWIDVHHAWNYAGDIRKSVQTTSAALAEQAIADSRKRDLDYDLRYFINEDRLSSLEQRIYSDMASPQYDGKWTDDGYKTWKEFSLDEKSDAIADEMSYSAKRIDLPSIDRNRQLEDYKLVARFHPDELKVWLNSVGMLEKVSYDVIGTFGANDVLNVFYWELSNTFKIITEDGHNTTHIKISNGQDKKQHLTAAQGKALEKLAVKHGDAVIKRIAYYAAGNT